MKDTRELGYYWVKKEASDKWSIAQWMNSFWVWGAHTFFNDCDFAEIDERQIVRPLSPLEQVFNDNSDTDTIYETTDKRFFFAESIAEMHIRAYEIKDKTIITHYRKRNNKI